MAETEAAHRRHVTREAADDFPSEAGKPSGRFLQYRLFEGMWDLRDGGGGIDFSGGDRVHV